MSCSLLQCGTYLPFFSAFVVFSRGKNSDGSTVGGDVAAYLAHDVSVII